MVYKQINKSFECQFVKNNKKKKSVNKNVCTNGVTGVFSEETVVQAGTVLLLHETVSPSFLASSSFASTYF